MKINKKAVKHFFIYFSAAFSVAIVSSLLYLFLPTVLESFDNRLRDYMFTIRGEIPQYDNVVVVDIDEKSLHHVGQWPWSRYKVAQLLENLTNAGVAVIGFDVVFAEADNSSPYKIFKKYNINIEDVPDYDRELATTIANTPTILGYQFQLEEDEFLNKKSPSIPAIFIEKNRDFGKDFLINAKGTILNIDMLQDNAYSSGFFNNIPDPSGIIRSVPLVMRYDENIYSSLALEIIRVAIGVNKVIINYDENGVESIKVGDFLIPTDRYGRLLINFRGPEKTFKYISAVDILNNSFDKKDIEGKVVLIGTSAAGLLDLRATPFESVYPGVEVHANLIDNILTGDFIHKPSWADGVNLTHIFLISLFVVFLLAYIPVMFIPLALVLLVGSGGYLLYYILFTQGLVFNIFFPIFTTVFATIVSVIIDYFLEIKQKNIVKNKFASKVSPAVMKDILKHEGDEIVEGSNKEITIFFSDIRGFTNISEAMPDAKALISFLNEYMDPMTEIIIEELGTVDKYIGDSIMAYWNAPQKVENHPDRALTAAVRQIEYLVPLNKRLKSENKPFIDIGIGINTGITTVGEMGSKRRNEYTVIGDPVNLASRLESLCKGYGAKIIISEYVKKRLKNKYIFRNLDIVRVKGKKEPVEIFEVHGFGEAKGRLKEELELFNKAVIFYRNANFKEALEKFEEINNWEDKKNLKICEIYINRCKHYIETLPEEFDVVFNHTTKE